MQHRKTELTERDVLNSRVITPIDVFVMNAFAAHPASGHYDGVIASRRVGHRKALEPQARQAAIAETSGGERRLFMIEGEEPKVQRVFHDPPATHSSN